MKLKHLFLVMLSGAALLRADDGAAEIANGSLRARHETAIAMVWERLDLSEDQVKVAFRFRNTTQQDVTTEVAFPWPTYEFSYGSTTWDPSMLVFNVRVEGEEVPFQTEIRATLNGKDVTDTLRKSGVDIASFGGHDGPADNDAHHHQGCQICSHPELRNTLLTAGLIDEDNAPLWKVSLQHHWNQRFPAGHELRIEHTYKPILGVQVLGLGELENQGKAIAAFINKPESGESREPGCADEAFEHQADKLKISKEHYALVSTWLRYILTSANTWQGPIGDFEMVVHRPKGGLISFCWDGPVTKTDHDTFVAKAKNFRPTKEVTVYFFQP